MFKELKFSCFNLFNIMHGIFIISNSSKFIVFVRKKTFMFGDNVHSWKWVPFFTHDSYYVFVLNNNSS